MTRNSKVFLTDILASIEKIERFTQGMTYDEFLNDEKTCDGVARNFEIIGEAVRNLPTAVKNQAPGVGWSDIIGMRNKLVHQYWGMDVEILWKVAQVDLPALKKEVVNLLSLEL